MSPAVAVFAGALSACGTGTAVIAASRLAAPFTIIRTCRGPRIARCKLWPGCRASLIAEPVAGTVAAVYKDARYLGGAMVLLEDVYREDDSDPDGEWTDPALLRPLGELVRIPGPWRQAAGWLLATARAARGGAR